MSETAKLSMALGRALEESNQWLTTAESCTGGMISAAVTDIAGSSGWFDRAFITYSNQAKMEMLGVESMALEQHGAVSEVVVEQMAAGALANSLATLAVAVSGIAGPGGGSEEKPVGTVCFGFAGEDGWKMQQTLHFDGDRAAVRHQVTEHALRVLYQHVSAGSDFSPAD